jgi:hypothetical protein
MRGETVTGRVVYHHCGHWLGFFMVHLAFDEGVLGSCHGTATGSKGFDLPITFVYFSCFMVRRDDWIIRLPYSSFRTGLLEHPGTLYISGIWTPLLLISLYSLPSTITHWTSRHKHTQEHTTTGPLVSLPLSPSPDTL